MLYFDYFSIGILIKIWTKQLNGQHIELLLDNHFIYQVLCTLIYRRRSLYSFLLE